MIQLGDVIKLRSSIFEDEFRKPKCEWSNKYLHEDQFDYVSLWFKKLGQPGDMVKTIFGSSESRVIKIEHSEDGQPHEVITDLFRIIYPLAIEKKEISASPFNGNFKFFQSDQELNEGLESFEEAYLEGLFSIMERENNKMDRYKLGFHLMKREGKWANR